MPHLRSMSLMTRAALLAVLAVMYSACGKQAEPEEEAPGAAADVAPHGGALVKVGEGEYLLELVHDPEGARFTAWVLDGATRAPVRLATPGFEVVALVAGRRQSLAMDARADAATGGTVGDTAVFSGTADWLKGRVAFDAYIPSLDVRGRNYTEVRFAFRSPSAP